MRNDLLIKYVEEKLVLVQKHPNYDLYIYNYTPKVQYEKLWDEITLMCRGLILDSEMNVIAKPFGKFFNIEEHTENELPKLPFDVYEKMDGSLGILYWIENNPFIATRGSFNSEQSIHACKVLYEKYSHIFNLLDKNSTYLFEIIYPQNKIVVDYGDMDDLVLLTIIDNNTGIERVENIGFPIVKKYNGINDLNELKKLEENNKEGFVIRFKNGFRIKMKFSEYVRLHRIITNVSNITIWEYLSQNKSFDELLEKVPDEFYQFVKQTKKEIEQNYKNVLDQCLIDYKELNTRKETSLYFETKKHPHILFSMLDKKDYSKIIWKIIKPKYQKPFKSE